MSDDNDDVLDEELTNVLDEIYDISLDGIKQVIEKLVDHYYEKTGVDTSILYNQTLIALTQVTGQVIACIEETGEDDGEGSLRDFIEERCVENISAARKDAEATHEACENDPHGLASMTTQGSC